MIYGIWVMLFDIISVIMTGIFSWYVGNMILGAKKIKPAPEAPPMNRFAVVVAAHNEERVIKETIQQLASSAYPHELYDIYVIADNCTDHTAKIAQNNGVIVLERRNETKRGKGYALQWGFDIIKVQKKYDAYVIIDADNIVSQSFLNKMNNELVAGHKVIQGYLGTKNPRDTWITRTIHSNYCMMNRLYQNSKARWGLCCCLGGTGFCMSSDVFEKYGWSCTTLTEDLELTIKLALDGEEVHFSHDAKVYDEKPLTFKAAVRQRQRWMQGHGDVMRLYGGKLLKKFPHGNKLLLFDSFVYLALPMMMTIWSIFYAPTLLVSLYHFDFASVAVGTTGISEILFPISLFFMAFWVVVPYVTLRTEGNRIRDYWYTPFTMWFISWVQLLLFMYGMMNHKNKEWIHTQHSAVADGGLDLR